MYVRKAGWDDMVVVLSALLRGVVKLVREENREMWGALAALLKPRVMSFKTEEKGKYTFRSPYCKLL